MSLEKTVNEEQLFSYLAEFSVLGDKLINSKPEIIQKLEEQGFISPMQTTVHSITALMRGEKNSFMTDHYVWTRYGTSQYNRLSEKYSLSN